MSIIKKITALSFSVLILTGCISNKGFYGYDNPESIEHDKVVTLEWSNGVELRTINKDKLKWTMGLKGLTTSYIKLKPGSYKLEVGYDNGSLYSLGTNILVVNLEEGEDYEIIHERSHRTITYDVINKYSYDSAVLDLNALYGKDNTTVSNYINFILNHTMEGEDKTVILENYNTRLVYKPDMVFELTDKDSGELTIGRRGFMTNLQVTEGTSYLYETDLETMTREDFLENSNYTEESEVAMKIISCSQDSVTYEYIRPESLKGKQETFLIFVEE